MEEKSSVLRTHLNISLDPNILLAYIEGMKPEDLYDFVTFVLLEEDKVEKSAFEACDWIEKLLEDQFKLRIAKRIIEHLIQDRPPNNKTIEHALHLIGLSDQLTEQPAKSD